MQSNRKKSNEKLQKENVLNLKCASRRPNNEWATGTRIRLK